MAPTGGYWDEDGEYVPRRDPNVIGTNYRCSNGHEWSETEPADP